MKINKNLFKEIDKKADRQKLLDSFMNERSYLQIAISYQDLVRKYAGRETWFLSSRQSTKVRENKIKQIIRLIEITVSLGVSPEIFMRAQFEQLADWIKKTKPAGFKYLPFGWMLTEKAVTRFETFSKRMENSYQQPKQALKEFLKTYTVDIGGSIARSVEVLYDALVRIKQFESLTFELAVSELEVAARTGLVSNIYVYCSPLVRKSENEYLRKIQRSVRRKLTPVQQESVKRIRSTILGTLEDKHAKKFI